jgi:N-acetylneuraminic acid mutarotase
VPEIERRQNHISRVDPNHPLLPIALNCLKDADGERPSAQQLCERVAALKETAKYKNASERVKDSRGKEGEYEQLQHVIDQKDATIEEKEQQLRQCREELTQQKSDKRQIKQERDQAIQESVEKNRAIREKERELGRVNQQLEESERLIADFGKRNTELEEELRVLRSQVQGKDGGAKAGAVSRTDFKLRWREGEKALCEIIRCYDAVVHNGTVYCKHDSNNKVYAYHISSSSWSLTPDSPYNGFALAVIDGLLTAIGGYGRDDLKITNKLFNLTGEGSGRRWTENIPPMPTKRYDVSAHALFTGTVLIVAGGRGDNNKAIKTVEVLNTETREWHTAADVPQPLSLSSLALCGDLVYLMGGFKKDDHATNSVYFCSLTSLLSPTGSTSLGGHLVSTLTRSSKGSPWNRVADLPVKRSTAVSLHGQLLTIGGRDSEDKPTTAVHMYQPTTNSWEIIKHMTTPRSQCLSAVLPGNQLMIVGGWTTGDERCDSVEFGTTF